MLISIDESKINDLQKRSILDLLICAKSMHYANVSMRRNATDFFFQADWLKHAEVTHINTSMYEVGDCPEQETTDQLTTKETP